jgi:MFS family permease
MSRDYPNFKRNFTFGVLNGTFFMAALAFLAGSTVLPVFISRLTDSLILIGLFSHLEWFGWLFPQLFAAVFLAHRERVLPFYNGLSAVRLSLFGICIASIFIFRHDYAAILIAFGISFTIFAFSSGMAGVAFTEVAGKVIPLNKRGSFFGLRMFSGGLLAALGGLLVKNIMATYPFPYDFGYVCMVAWGLMLLGLAAFALLKEPKVKEQMVKASPSIQLKSALGILKKDENFRRLIFSRIWINTALLAIPFYIVFSIEKLDAPEWIAGIYLTAQMIGYLASNLLWGWLSNRISNKTVIVLAALCRVFSPVMAFICFYYPVSPAMFAAVFVFMGMAESGIDMGYMTYLLEISPEKGRVLSIGLFHTVIAPTVLLSGVGGWFSQILSLKWLFGVVSITTLISLIISAGLREPRLRSS